MAFLVASAAKLKMCGISVLVAAVDIDVSDSEREDVQSLCSGGVWCLRQRLRWRRRRAASLILVVAGNVLLW